MQKLICIFLFVACSLPALSQASSVGPTAAAPAISLPAPERSGGMTLNDALNKRRSVRAFNPTKLTLPQISQLLWAAQGITGENGHRTAPSAHAQYYLHVYLATADGFYEYLPAKHSLQMLGTQDLRAKLSTQPTVAAAPAVFLIAGEYARANKDAGARGNRFVDLEAGHAAQNMLLEATAMGLGAVSVGGIKPQQTAAAASLPSSITPIYLVPTGQPK